MQGYQIIFFTQQNRMHGKQTVGQWLLSKAKELGFGGATLSGALEGFGHDGKVHMLNMFDYADQPVQVTMVLSKPDTERLFAELDKEKVKVFYTRSEVDFGMLGGA